MKSDIQQETTPVPSPARPVLAHMYRLMLVDRGITVAQVAQELGLSEQTVAEWVDIHKGPSSYEVEARLEGAIEAITIRNRWTPEPISNFQDELVRLQLEPIMQEGVE